VRTELEQLGTEKRHRFRSRVTDFGGRTTCFGKYCVPMILLTHVVLAATGREVTDHVWFTQGKSWEPYAVGDWVEFDARVGEYVNGYYKDVWDYKLNNPTKIKKLDLTPEDLAAMKKNTLAEYDASLADWEKRKRQWEDAKPMETVNVKRLRPPLPNEDYGKLVPNWCKNKGRGNTWEFFGVVSHSGKSVQVKCKRPKAFPENLPKRPSLKF
jgi:hypothetical protein